MRKIIASFVLLAATLTGVAVAQTHSVFTWASDFNKWSVVGQAPNTYTFTSPLMCQFPNPYTASTFGFNTNAALYIRDAVTANSEIVAVSTVSTSPCGFVPTSLAHNHYTFEVKSGTAGLQEALNSASKTSSYPADVIIDQTFYTNAVSIGTTASALIAAATGGVGINIVDTTTTQWQFYSWNSTTSKYQGAQNTSSITVTQAAPGQVRAITGSITTSNASFSDGNSSMVGIRGAVTIPAGTTASAGYAYGTQGKEIVAGTLAGSSWTTAVLGQLDISAATLTSGSHISPAWLDAGATGPSVSCAFCDMEVLTNTTATTFNSLIFAAAKATYFLDASNSTYNTLWLASSSGSCTTTSYTIKVNTPGGAGYIHVCTS
jgi:hypothetical protein